MAETTGQKPTVAEGLASNSTAVAGWFAVLDAAKDPALPGRASASGARTASLYAGEIGARFSNVAPHLVELDLKSEFTTRFLSHWGRSVGILLQSSASFNDVRKHLRKFLLVKDEAGVKCRFRFYDPRVLRAFLPVCTADEATEFFGPVVRFFGEGRFGTTLLVFTRSPRGVSVNEVAVRRAPPADSDAADTQPPRPAGSVSVTFVDAKTGQPIIGASVRIAGPDERTALTTVGGKARFEGMPPGEYEVFAIDGEHRMATVKTTVGQDLTRVSLRGRTTGGTRRNA
jgi:hypothetical protein